MADDVLAVCRAEGVGEAVIGGVSVGSGIALLLGLDHPEMFRAVILVGGSSGGGGRTGDRIEGYTDDVTTYHEKHIKELVAPGFESTRLGKYLLDIFLERNPWLSGESIAQIFRARAGTDMTPRLSEMKVPTLVINGEHDMSLEGGQEDRGADSRGRAQGAAGNGPRLLHRGPCGLRRPSSSSSCGSNGLME